jgi:hypothetical protein
MEENKRISDLFERARTEAPKTSFEDVKGHFLATSAVAGTGLLAKWAAASFKFKAIVMVTILSTLTISTVLIVSSISSATQSEIKHESEVLDSGDQTIEILNENGVKKKTVYDENNSVLEVIVDSSKQWNKDGELINHESAVELLPFEVTEVVNEDLEGIEVVEGAISLVDAEEDSLTMQRFTISNKTTEEELEAMKKAAMEAGVSIQFSARIRRSTLKRLSLVMSIEADGKRKYKRSCVYKAKTFSFQTGWMEDDNGKAIRFLEEDEIKPFVARY